MYFKAIINDVAKKMIQGVDQWPRTQAVLQYLCKTQLL